MSPTRWLLCPSLAIRPTPWPLRRWPNCFRAGASAVCAPWNWPGAWARSTASRNSSRCSDARMQNNCMLECLGRRLPGAQLRQLGFQLRQALSLSCHLPSIGFRLLLGLPLGPLGLTLGLLGLTLGLLGLAFGLVGRDCLSGQ